MANFNTMFAGFESFMEGDVEINNDVTIPASDGEALEAETVAEDVGTEGGEIAGEAETEDVKAEAVNMIFDQVLNMDQHVKSNGIDRTFLALYNGQGQLNNMIGYKFPSCESMDSVGSPRSSASRAFIAAMESDGGIFSKIWAWIKEQWARLVNFFRKVMDWFRDACGNLDVRVGRLLKYYNSSTDKQLKDVKDKSVKYFSTAKIKQYNDAATKVATVLTKFGSTVKLDVAPGKGMSALVDVCAEAVDKIQKSIQNSLRAIVSAANTAAGGAEDPDNKYGNLKQYLDNIDKEALEPLSSAIGGLGKESDSLAKVGSKGSIAVTIADKDNKLTGQGTIATGEEQDCGVKVAMVTMLQSCTNVLRYVLQQKQSMDLMKRALEMGKQTTAQAKDQASGSDSGRDAAKAAKEETLAAIKCNSVLAKVVGLEEKLVAKCCKVAASYTSCVNSKAP